MRHFLLLALFMTIILPAAAQNEDPDTVLEGPLLVTNANEQDRLIIFDITNGTERSLSFGPGDHFVGGFSPDGCEILFIWEAEQGKSNLYAAQLDGSSLRKLTFIDDESVSGYRVWEPEWSPDGERIVFTYIRYYDTPEARRTTHIAWVPAPGGSPAFYSNSGSEGQPRWSPDGTRLVYVSTQPVEGIEEEIIKQELWMVGVDGNNKRRLTSFGEGAAYNPRWSPNGDRIAFIFQPLEQQLMVMASDGNAGPFLVMPQQAMVLDFTWQPTGRNLIGAIRGLEGQNENKLWQIPASQSNTAAALFVDDLYLDFPRFSADGAWLAFRRAYELALTSITRQEIRTFGDETKNNSPPVWSPAGFVSESDCP
jgi:Tol biopolymer transport system component